MVTQYNFKPEKNVLINMFGKKMRNGKVHVNATLEQKAKCIDALLLAVLTKYGEGVLSA